MKTSNWARTVVLAAIAAGTLTAFGSATALATEVGRGQLYLNGQVVGTVVPPASVTPGSGQDPFFKITNGVSGQLAIAGVGPGQPGFHGGDWEVFTVTFNSAPYLLTSGSDVLAAQ